MSSELMKKSYNSDHLTDNSRLTDAGEKLIKVLQVPENRIASVTDICKRADISRDSYYRLFKDPEFLQCYQDLCRNTLLSFAMPASQALGKQAETGDVAAIKMVLEMSGLYQQSANLNVNQQVEAGPTLKEILARRKTNQNIKIEGSN